MTRNTYKNLLIESAVADIKKIEVFKSPADKVLASTKKMTVTDDISKVRDAESAISVLGRIYDAQDNDRPLIRENDEENEAQGDSEIAVDLPDTVSSAKIQDIADVIDDDAGCEPNPGQKDEFKDSIQDEAVDNKLDESFILEGDEDLEDLPEDEEEEDDESDTVDPDEDEGVTEEDDELPEDEADDDTCPECGKDPCECEDDEDKNVVTDDSVEDDEEELPEDELPEDEAEEAKCEDDDELPEDEPETDDDSVEDDDELPEDETSDDSDVTEEDDELPEDEPEADDSDDESEDELPEDEEDDHDESDVTEEDVSDSTLDEVEQTGNDALLADGASGDADVPAEEIDRDGEVYEDAEDPTVDPNETPAAEPEKDVPAADTEKPEDEKPEDPTEDPNEAPAAEPEQNPEEAQEEEKKDPVLDIDSQVVASDTTNESVMESLIRSFNESTEEGYMNYESDDLESED